MPSGWSGQAGREGRLALARPSLQSADRPRLRGRPGETLRSCGAQPTGGGTERHSEAPGRLPFRHFALTTVAHRQASVPGLRSLDPATSLRFCIIRKGKRLFKRGITTCFPRRLFLIREAKCLFALGVGRNPGSFLRMTGFFGQNPNWITRSRN